VSLARVAGSPAVGVEHLVAAVLDENSDCAKVLLRCGVKKEAVLALSESRHRERPAPKNEAPAASVEVAPVAREFLARAAGVAAAFGETPARSEHLVVALIWTDVGTRVQRLLQDVPGGRPRVATELRSAGVRVPESDPPPWPKWGARRELTAEEADAYMRALRERGERFMFNWRNGKAIVVVAEGYERR
jgi:ATP-dependent Clp protease ATP-binding subunit ClpA